MIEMTATYTAQGEWIELTPRTWGFVRDDPRFYEKLDEGGIPFAKMCGVIDKETYIDSIRKLISGERGKRSWIGSYEQEPGKTMSAHLSIVVEVIPPGEEFLPGTGKANNNPEGKTAYRIITRNDIYRRFMGGGPNVLQYTIWEGIEERLERFPKPPFLE